MVELFDSNMVTDIMLQAKFLNLNSIFW